MSNATDAYDAAARTRTPLAVAQEAVGKRARLPLTGTIIDAGESRAGAYVKIEVDTRWGFGAQVFVVDLEALELIA